MNIKTFNKDEFKKYAGSWRFKDTDSLWEKISKGYDFVIGIYDRAHKRYKFYSVDYLVNKNCPKEDEIIIKEMNIVAYNLCTSDGIVEFIVEGFRVTFEYNSIDSNVFIESNRVLTVKEVKEEIINRFFNKVFDVKEDMCMW